MTIPFFITVVFLFFVIRRCRRLHQENEENKNLANRLIQLINGLGNPPSPYNIEKSERELFFEITREDDSDTDIILEYLKETNKE